MKSKIKYVDSHTFGCVNDYVNTIEEVIYPQIRELEADYKIAVNALKKILNSDMQPYDFIYKILEEIGEKDGVS